MTYEIIHGHAIDVLQALPDKVIQMAVTSPPYFGLRRYPIPDVWWGGDSECSHPILGSAFCAECGAWLGQYGQEPTLDLYVHHTLLWAREVRRVLKDDGILWLNIGDTFAGSGRGLMGSGEHSPEYGTKQGTNKGTLESGLHKAPIPQGMKPQDLMMVPATVAMALRTDGWHLASEIVWYKPNGFCESTKRRPTKVTERIYMLAKGYPYLYNYEDAREPAKTEKDRNWRDLWVVNTQPTRVQHFSAFPEEIAARCIVAGSKEGDWVLDPFSGTGRTGQAAVGLGRSYLGIELSEMFVEESSKILEEAG